jgi:protein tyrosine phosphatase (PTP) superfamily phosphohydrolase (DUF442 family)
MKNTKSIISKITDYLYMGGEPSVEQVNELGNQGVRLIICMIGGRTPPEGFNRHPYRLLWLQTYDSFLTPIPISVLAHGTQAALSMIKQGGGVFAYCAFGRHRSAAMASAILIANGHSAHEAIELLLSRSTTADPKVLHIYNRIIAFEKYWKNQDGLFSKLGLYLDDIYCIVVTNLVSIVAPLYFLWKKS